MDRKKQKNLQCFSFLHCHVSNAQKAKLLSTLLKLHTQLLLMFLLKEAQQKLKKVSRRREFKTCGNPLWITILAAGTINKMMRLATSKTVWLKLFKSNNVAYWWSKASTVFKKFYWEVIFTEKKSRTLEKRDTGIFAN